MTAITEAANVPGASAPEGWMTGAWAIDPAHSTVAFAVRHLMSKVRGTFSEVSGQVVTAAGVRGSAAASVIAVSSVSTGVEARDAHLRSVDFFDAERFPEMRFTTTGLHPAGGGWLLAGELTIRDVTRPVDLEVEYLGTDPDGLQGEPRIGFCARTVIRRETSASPSAWPPRATRCSSVMTSTSSWTSRRSWTARAARVLRGTAVSEPGRAPARHRDHATR